MVRFSTVGALLTIGFAVELPADWTEVTRVATSTVSTFRVCWNSLAPQLLVPLQLDVGRLVGSNSVRVLQAGKRSR